MNKYLMKRIGTILN